MEAADQQGPGEQAWDAIIIGSGIGGLTCGAILSRMFSKKVLILEQHGKVGGFTHSFSRENSFTWDTGVHYVGDMSPGKTGRAVFDYMTRNSLRWKKLPDPFESFQYPNHKISISSGKSAFLRELASKFPHEKKGLKAYLRAIHINALLYNIPLMMESSPFLMRWIFRTIRFFLKVTGQDWSDRTTDEFLKRFFSDARLRSILDSRFGDFGLPAHKSPAGLHSLIQLHYMNGAFVPEGGSGAIARAILPVLEESGGRVITGQRVLQILVEDGRATGVRAFNPREGGPEKTYHAPIIISDAGAWNTYQKLLPADSSISFRDEIQNYPEGYAVFTIFVGLNKDPQEWAPKEKIVWLFQDYDHDAGFTQQWKDPTRHIHTAFVSFAQDGQLKEKENFPGSHGPVCTIITAMPYEPFEQWKDQMVKKRDEQYQKLKSAILHQILDFVDSKIPGFKENIQFVEGSTPLTIEHYDGSNKGVIYGIPAHPGRNHKSWISSRTPIQGLFLTGTDAYMAGLIGATMGGVKTSAMVMKKSMIQVIGSILRESKTKPNRAPSVD